MALCFRIRICCIVKCGRLKVEWCFKRRQISHFLTLVKIRGGVGEIHIGLPTVEALPMTEPPFDGRPLRGCWARWIDKKKEKSLWVKLKAFLTNAGRPKMENFWKISGNYNVHTFQSTLVAKKPLDLRPTLLLMSHSVFDPTYHQSFGGNCSPCPPPPRKWRPLSSVQNLSEIE